MTLADGAAWEAWGLGWGVLSQCERLAFVGEDGRVRVVDANIT